MASPWTLPANGASEGGGRRLGFTLIELLVVLLVIGLLFALLPTALMQSLPGVELKASARDLATLLREGRGLAIHENREVAVVIDTESRTVRLEHRSEGKQFSRQIAMALLTAQSEQIDGGTGVIRFYGDGSSTGGGVTLSSGDRSHRVVVDWLSGHVAIR